MPGTHRSPPSHRAKQSTASDNHDQRATYQKQIHRRHAQFLQVCGVVAGGEVGAPQHRGATWHFGDEVEIRTLNARGCCCFDRLADAILFKERGQDSDMQSRGASMSNPRRGCRTNLASRLDHAQRVRRCMAKLTCRSRRKVAWHESELRAINAGYETSAPESTTAPTRLHRAECDDCQMGSNNVTCDKHCNTPRRRSQRQCRWI